MPIGAVLGIASAVGGIAQAGAASKAAKSQEGAAREQLALQREIYDDTRKLGQPYYDAGVGGLNALNFEMGLGDRPEGYGGFKATPGYNFARSEGLRAIDGSAASRGTLFSGETMRAASEFGTGLANQEYGNYLNRLFSLSGGGLDAATLGQNAGQSYAAGASNALAGIGNARSAGAVGIGNAINSAIGNGIGAWQYSNLLNNYQTRV